MFVAECMRKATLNMMSVWYNVGNPIYGDSLPTASENRVSEREDDNVGMVGVIPTGIIL